MLLAHTAQPRSPRSGTGWATQRAAWETGRCPAECEGWPLGVGMGCLPPSCPENRSPLSLASWAGRTRGAPAWLSAYVRPTGGCTPSPWGARRALVGAAALLPRQTPASPSPAPLPGDRGEVRDQRPGPGVLPPPPASRGRSSASRKHPGVARGRGKARGGSGI